LPLAHTVESGGVRVGIKGLQNVLVMPRAAAAIVHSAKKGSAKLGINAMQKNTTVDLTLLESVENLVWNSHLRFEKGYKLLHIPPIQCLPTPSAPIPRMQHSM
jgi:hypothetical protein